MTIAETPSGQLRGVETDGAIVFRGIPYASPPIGPLRHRPPQAPEPWHGIRDATTFGPISPQAQPVASGGVMDTIQVPQPTDEDSLLLNIWTPACDDGRRPVLVWLHGGAFARGSGSVHLYDGSAFAHDDVVLVTLNYRLGALGYLYLDRLFDGAEGTGNLGLLDQVAALAWVRDDISAFGGDPGNVTLFGGSAGGMSVGALLATPAAEGLFRRAIASSGAAHIAQPGDAAHEIAVASLEILGVEPGDWDSLLAVSVDDLVALPSKLGQHQPRVTTVRASPPMWFLPTLDGTVLPRRAVDAPGTGPRLELLLGYCAEEHRFFYWGIGPSGAMMPPPDIEAVFGGTATADEVLSVYAAQSRGDERSAHAAIWTDLTYRIPAIRLADVHRRSGGTAWVYRFDLRTPVQDGELGACHGLDLPYIFGTLAGAAALVGDDPPAAFADEIRGAWVRFARTGDPGGGGLPAWPPYGEDRYVMSLDVVPELLVDPDPDSYRLWESVPDDRLS